MRRLLTDFPKLFWAILVLSIPLLGFWLSSSLTVYFNGPLWLAVAVGLFFFPVLPLAWGVWSNPKRPHLLLRTFAVNLLLLIGLLAFYPKESFEALSTRGDWMFEKKRGPIYDAGREAMFLAADKLEWLYLAAKEKQIVPKPAPKPRVASKRKKVKTATIARKVSEKVPKNPAQESAQESVQRDLWPMSKRPHPLIAKIPLEVETSWQSVARHLAERERDPYLRVKAIHDYIADRISYDVKTMLATDLSHRAKQDPKTVFETRLAVCDGYSQLFQAMVEEVGGNVEYIGGEARDSDGSVSGRLHAWNAVEIAGQWYLVDVTWDAGHVKGHRFEKQYSTDYLLTPPELFVITHFPAHEKWQLLTKPIRRGEFLRKPMLRPSFYSEGLVLVSPDRSQVTVEGRTFEIELENPGRFYLLGTVSAKQAREERECVVRYQKSGAKIQCRLPAPGEYVVRMYGSKVAYGSYPMIGTFDVNAEG